MISPSDLPLGAVPPGLDPAEAAARLDVDGPNRLPAPARLSLLRRTGTELREPMALLLLAAASVEAFVLDKPIDAAVIAVIVAVNTTISLVQQGRAEAALDALAAFEVPLTRVRRAGRTIEVPAADLVRGDVVVLRAGDRVPADVHLLGADGLEVDEAILTGESMPVAKDIGGQAYSGTLAVRGSGIGEVVATGSATALGSIAGGLARRPPATPLQTELARLTVALGAAAVVAAAGLSLVVLIRGEGLEAALLGGVALGVAAVPEGMATVTAIALALGVRRMAGRGAIVRRLPAVETLGSVTVIAFDKTGTVTENRLKLDHLVAGTGAGRLSPGDSDVTDAAAQVAALCSEATLDPPIGDPVEIALLELVSPEQLDTLRQDRPRLATIPFDSDRKRMTTLHRGGEGGPPFVLMVKGAPEAVAPRCTSALAPTGEMVPLGPDARQALARAADDLAGTGARLLALARRSLRAPPVALDESEHDLTLVALAALRDPVRPGAPETLRALANAGVRTVMVTGDHPGTAGSVALDVGLMRTEDRLTTGPEIRASGLPDQPLDFAVYARVDPDQKLALVDRLREQGEVVAVTGDGVNDAPALRAADIGVALGRTGSEVAREAADMVITDDDLATLGMAVAEGRGIYANIRKVVEYLVAGNLSEILVVATAFVLYPDLGVPLLPLQILWVNLLTDGLPALALGIDPVDHSVMRCPPRSPSERMLGSRQLARLTRRGAVLAAAPLAGLGVSRLLVGESWSHGRTVLLTTLVAGHLFYSWAVRAEPNRPFRSPAENPWLLASVAAGIALQIAVVAWDPAHRVFGTHDLHPLEWAVAFTFGFAATIATAYLTAQDRRRDSRRSKD